ncbi:hypothetical protein VE03_10265 [Pseudogymnoascus sp. 23342-1-I1]|nr:hypothetical protein VE03_10265 [Pseudogymnoascus sp. 23342-1-I1]
MPIVRPSTSVSTDVPTVISKINMFQKLIDEEVRSHRELLADDDGQVASKSESCVVHVRVQPHGHDGVQDAHDAHEDDKHAIVVDGVQSVTHFSLIKLAFELMQAGSGRLMNMIMCVSMSGDSARIVNTVLKPNPNLLIFTDICHEMMMMERLRSRFSVTETCLIANMCSSSAEFEKACMATVQFVNMTVCLTTYEAVTEIKRMMIRPMSLGRTCYDCHVAKMVSLLILRMIGNKDPDVIGDAEEDWSEIFATPITTDAVEIEV